MILGEELATYFLYVLCPNHQNKHQILQEMSQNRLEEEINIPKEV
jgi:hypothetical protein